MDYQGILLIAMEAPEKHQPHIIDPVDDPKSKLYVEKNLYPSIRHLFLVISLLLAISVIVFLVYQNGKSIYDHGI
jgi:hypothetical protein